MADKDTKLNTAPGGEGSGATSPLAGTTSPEGTMDSPGGDSTITPGQDDDEHLQRMIRANTITEQDMVAEAEETQSKLSKFQSLVNARSRNRSRYSAASTFKMEKRYGLFSCVCVIICVVIGSGIFINAHDALKNIRSPAATLLVWFLMGLHSTFGALCYAELGTTLPVSGGDYAYINEAFGSFLGFQYQWCSSILFIPAVNAILARTVIDYMLDAIYFYTGPPEFEKQKLSDPPTAPSLALSSTLQIILLCLVVFGNILTSKFAEKLQNYLTVAKLTACAIIIVVGIVRLAQTSGEFKTDPSSWKVINFTFLTNPNSTNSTNSTCSTKDFMGKLSGFGAGIYDIYFSYLGWTYLNFITEELQDPYRNLPIAICIALPLITGVYCIMNVSYYAVLSKIQLESTKVIATDTFKEILKSDDSKKALYWVAPAVVMFSAFGALVGHVMAMSRVLYVAPRFNHAPMVFNQLHEEWLTPIPALIIQGIMTVIFIIIQNFTLVILMSAYTETSFTCIALIGMLHLRFQKPELERPIKLWIGLPIIFVTVSIVLFLIPIVSVIFDFECDRVRVITLPMIVGAFLAVFSGVLVYFLFIWKRALVPATCRASIGSKLDAFSERWLHTKKSE